MTGTLLTPWNFIQELVTVTMSNGLQIFFQQMASSNHSTNCVNTSDEEDFSSNEESSSDSMETAKSVPGKLRLDELQILQDSLKDWKEADTNKRASLMEGMQNKIKWLDANKSLKQNEWNRKWMAIKNWMYNNNQSWAWKALVKYGSKWTTLKVIKLQHKKDIQQVLVKARIQPRTSAMIKHYQPAIQKVVQSSTKPELDQAAHLAKEWNERKLPPKAQAEVATIWTQHVEAVWDESGDHKDGEVMVRVNDFNDKLSDGELYLDWEDLHGKANGTEDGSGEDEASQTMVKAWKGKKWSQFSLSTNDNGTPILPNLLDLWTPELKDIMRVFITGHYCLACWKMNASIPWAAITDNQASYLSSKWRSQYGSLEELVTKQQFWSEKAKGKRPWTEVNSADGSDYGHHSEEEPAPPTKPCTKWQWIDEHPMHRRTTDEGTSPHQTGAIQLLHTPSQLHSTAAQNDNMVISKSHHGNGGSREGLTPNDWRNSNTRPRGHVMDREDRLLDQAEENGVACHPEQNWRPPQWPDDNYPTPTGIGIIPICSVGIGKMKYLELVICHWNVRIEYPAAEGLKHELLVWEFNPIPYSSDQIGIVCSIDVWLFVEYQLPAVWQTPGRLQKAPNVKMGLALVMGIWLALPELGRCSGDLSHASSSNRVLSERHVDMESQGGSTNGLPEEGDSANDSNAGSIKGGLGEPEDWKEGSILVVHIV
ncbi:hypothetical protein F5J12DRAFT_781782 [Pisolithus orientalis]|uniref:uncharacterized protein n=1 Tax=Pisolithus orientalis TaxID=936130 RepID=UPI0022246EBB|nr:uncharacterized protein F5J12DRAFT_781782 [Pisolithus orientalis]KAI6010799.1 hypothetical protein F5J12DRAFT_781782 [Pisolithus orientalis]